MGLWNQVGRKQEQESKPTEYYLDYQAFPILFDIYGIESSEDRQTVLQVMSMITSMFTSSPLSVEQIFGWSPIPDDDELL